MATSGALLAVTGAVPGGFAGGIAATRGIGGAAGAAGGAGAGALIAAGAVGAAVGSAVSQGFGVLTGLQDRFSWKGVALAALGGAIGGATGVGGLMGKGGAFSGVGNAFVQGALRGGLSSGLAQGIGVADGLQKKFDFAGVTAAVVGGGVGATFGKGLGIGPSLSLANVSKTLATSMAGNLANAATRSLISGTDFGDNIIAAAPDVIASTVGGGIGAVAAEHDNANGLTNSELRRIKQRYALSGDHSAATAAHETEHSAATGTMSELLENLMPPENIDPKKDPYSRIGRTVATNLGTPFTTIRMCGDGTALMILEWLEPHR